MKLINTLLILTCFYSIMNSRLEACSFTPKALLTPDFNETIFFGYAESYVQQAESQFMRVKAHGIRFKVVQILHAPQIRKTYDVFPFSYNSMCVDENERDAEIQRRYPLGKYYLVVAGKTRIFENDLLKSRSKLSQSIAIATFNGASLDLTTEMNYAVSAASLPMCKAEEITDSCINSHGIEEIMYRIDLFRLFQEKNEAIRVKILNRIMLYGGIDSLQKEYLIRIYVKDESSRKQLLQAIPRRHEP